MLLLESEGTGHSATARSCFDDFDISPFKSGDGRAGAHHRFLMTVAMKQRSLSAILKVEGEAIGSFFQEKFFEQETRLSHFISVIVSEQFHRFIAQCEQARGF